MPAPVFLLADSQTLFAHDPGVTLRARLREALDASPFSRSAAYLGAANGDEPAFFELFRAAMDPLDVHDCTLVPGEPDASHRAALERAALVFLAGGDPLRAWASFQRAGLVSRLHARHAAGALMVGLSAGAVLLGTRATGGTQSVPTLAMVPRVLDAHDEPGWLALRRDVGDDGAVGIRAGGAAVYRDGAFEAIRRPLDVFSRDGHGAVQHTVVPPR